MEPKNHGDGVPRITWEPVGDWSKIPDSKHIALYNYKTGWPTYGVIRLSETSDERGELWTDDCGHKLNFDDYSHYSYVCSPLDGFPET